MHVKIVRVMRFLFSEMMDPGSLGGELGVEEDFSSAEVDIIDGCGACCDFRLEWESKKGLGVGVRF